MLSGNGVWLGSVISGFKEFADENRKTPDRDATTNQSSADSTEGHHFLQEDEERKTADPPQAHHTSKEEQSHQDPAAPEAEGPVFDAHPKGAQVARFPMRGNEVHRRAAVPKAGVFGWRQLVNSGGQQEESAENLANEDAPNALKERGSK